MSSKKKEIKIEALMSIGIDIGKDVFHLVGFDPDGNVVVRKKIKRMALEKTFEDLPSLEWKPVSAPTLLAGRCARWVLNRVSFLPFM